MSLSRLPENSEPSWVISHPDWPAQLQPHSPSPAVNNGWVEGKNRAPTAHPTAAVLAHVWWNHSWIQGQGHETVHHSSNHRQGGKERSTLLHFPLLPTRLAGSGLGMLGQVCATRGSAPSLTPHLGSQWYGPPSCKLSAYGCNKKAPDCMLISTGLAAADT